ncbi:Protein FAR-RED IMPAIRED RESPONSE 1 [Acorus gramineus]|uniref:Protein FAR1-RELATED SEQUENCE n=1 Tax=Acorus gramineus TaxID=55184 RepID=A0AAV8ZZC9_ACOGR|nr:Protein FAR-RED IMPAIRED RESPONSE 1 [Acorus gramineus]
MEDNEWLNSLYEDRERLVPIFVRDTFWAGMSTTQRSESMNAYFDDYLTSKTTLKQFVHQYENAFRNKHEKEALEEFHSFHSTPQLISPLKMEEQLANSYTINMFKKF